MTRERNKRKLGAKVEQMVKEYISENGMSVLEMNYRCRQGEIDIIAKDGAYYVFIEVKYRSNTNFGTPQEAVDLSKQKRICKAAQYYMYSHHLSEFTPVRFDVVAVLDKDISYFSNAFEFVV